MRAFYRQFFYFFGTIIHDSSQYFTSISYVVKLIWTVKVPIRYQNHRIIFNDGERKVLKSGLFLSCISSMVIVNEDRHYISLKGNVVTT